MIEVEAAEVVLVRLPLAAVLADDDPRYGLDDLARALERPPIDLLRGDHSLGGRVGDADQIVHRLVEIGEVAEGLLRGDDHLGGGGEVQRAIDARRRAVAHRDAAPNARREVEEPEGDVVGSGPDRQRVRAVDSRDGASRVAAAGVTTALGA
jgi:hypothetical protein